MDLDRYKKGLAVCQNYLPTPQGPIVRRPGTYFVAEVKDSTKKTVIRAFRFSNQQAYGIEMGNLYFRFYRNQGQILSAGSPYEIVTPYQEADLPDLRFCQSADVLHITHKNYAPRKLSRTGDTAWTLSIAGFVDGPYLDINDTTVTIAASGTTGTVTLTASVGIFLATDIGRHVRLFTNAVWGFAVITAFTDTSHVTAVVQTAYGDTNPTATWRLGLWSDTTGYPSFSCFHEGRQWYCGSPAAIERVDGSRVQNFSSFSPTNPNGTVVDTHALAVTLDTTDVQNIVALVSDSRGLQVFTGSSEQLIAPAGTASGITPTNVKAYPESEYGSASVPPIKVGGATLYVQQSGDPAQPGRRIREYIWDFTVDGFRSENLSQLAASFTLPGVKEMAFQKERVPILWCVMQDGTLAAMVYERSANQIYVGWAPQVFGGASTANGSQARVESVMAIPSSFGGYTEVWFVVQRFINGRSVRYVEFLTDVFDEGYFETTAYFVDCGLQRTGIANITSITNNGPATITTAAPHGFVDGDKVFVAEVIGMPEINNRVYTVTFVDATTFMVDADTTAFGGYASGGRAANRVGTITGLTHLEGASVSILGDGAPQSGRVNGGTVALSQTAGFITAGLTFTSDGKMLRQDAGSANGTSIGKKRRVHKFAIQVLELLNLKVGMAFDDTMVEIARRSSTHDVMSVAPALKTGLLESPIDANYDLDNQLCWRQDQPLPGTILAVAIQMDTQDAQ